MNVKSIFKEIDKCNRYFIAYFPIAVGVAFLSVLQWAEANGCSVNFDPATSLQVGVGFGVMFALSSKIGKFKK